MKLIDPKDLFASLAGNDGTIERGKAWAYFFAHAPAPPGWWKPPAVASLDPRPKCPWTREVIGDNGQSQSTLYGNWMQWNRGELLREECPHLFADLTPELEEWFAAYQKEDTEWLRQANARTSVNDLTSGLMWRCFWANAAVRLARSDVSEYRTIAREVMSLHVRQMIEHRRVLFIRDISPTEQEFFWAGELVEVSPSTGRWVDAKLVTAHPTQGSTYQVQRLDDNEERYQPFHQSCIRKKKAPPAGYRKPEGTVFTNEAGEEFCKGDEVEVQRPSPYGGWTPGWLVESATHDHEWFLTLVGKDTPTTRMENVRPRNVRKKHNAGYQPPTHVRSGDLDAKIVPPQRSEEAAATLQRYEAALATAREVYINLKGGSQAAAQVVDALDALKEYCSDKTDEAAIYYQALRKVQRLFDAHVPIGEPAAEAAQIVAAALDGDTYPPSFYEEQAQRYYNALSQAKAHLERVAGDPKQDATLALRAVKEALDGGGEGGPHARLR
jgi:hypothetical protein